MSENTGLERPSAPLSPGSCSYSTTAHGAAASWINFAHFAFPLEAAPGFYAEILEIVVISSPNLFLGNLVSVSPGLNIVF